MRGLVNAFGAWFDSGQDAFDEAVRFLTMIGVVLVVVLLLVGGGVLLMLRVAPSAEPQLFCRNGTYVRSEPATRIIGKVPVAGMRFTCGD